MLQSRPPDRAWEGIIHFCGPLKTKLVKPNFCRWPEENSLPQKFAISVRRNFCAIARCLQNFRHRRSYTACLCLISGATHPTAPAAGDQLVRAHHLDSFDKFPPNLLLRRPSHNYCCSGTHRPAAIALASSPLPIFDWRDATVPTSRSCLGRHYSFLWPTKN